MVVYRQAGCRTELSHQRIWFRAPWQAKRWYLEAGNVSNGRPRSAREPAGVGVGPECKARRPPSIIGTDTNSVVRHDGVPK